MSYKYIGESLDGKAHGYGTAYYNNGQIKYEGEFRNGKRILSEKHILKMASLQQRERDLTSRL